LLDLIELDTSKLDPIFYFYLGGTPLRDDILLKEIGFSKDISAQAPMRKDDFSWWPKIFRSRFI